MKLGEIKRWQWFIVMLPFAVMFLFGCAGTQVKDAQNQILGEVNQIVQTSDCPTTCELIKQYIKSKLGQ